MAEERGGVVVCWPYYIATKEVLTDWNNPNKYGRQDKAMIHLCSPPCSTLLPFFSFPHPCPPSCSGFANSIRTNNKDESNKCDSSHIPHTYHTHTTGPRSWSLVSPFPFPIVILSSPLSPLSSLLHSHFAIILSIQLFSFCEASFVLSYTFTHSPLFLSRPSSREDILRTNVQSGTETGFLPVVL